MTFVTTVSLGAEAERTSLGQDFVGDSGVRALASQVTRQTCRREGKPFCKRNSHNGARIGSGINLEFKSWGGLHLGEKCSELGF